MAAAADDGHQEHLMLLLSMRFAVPEFVQQ